MTVSWLQEYADDYKEMRTLSFPDRESAESYADQLRAVGVPDVEVTP